MFQYAPCICVIIHSRFQGVRGFSSSFSLLATMLTSVSFVRLLVLVLNEQVQHRC